MKKKRARLSKPAKRAKRARKRSTLQDIYIYTYSDKNRNPEFAARVYWALLRAAESARRTARMYGTPLYYWENGRVVAKRP
jgi:hypothetical protein